MKKPYLHSIRESVQVWNNWFKEDAVLIDIRHDEFTKESGEFTTGILARLPNGEDEILISVNRFLSDENAEIEKEMARHRLLKDLHAHGIVDLIKALYTMSQTNGHRPGGSSNGEFAATFEIMVGGKISAIWLQEKSHDEKVAESIKLFMKLFTSQNA